MEFKDELAFFKEQLMFKDSIGSVDSYNNIVIGGMGGAVMGGRIIQELYSEKPVYIVDDYRGPKFISKKTLFIAMSFSGNTEETISSAMDARSKGAYMVTISAGGKLQQYGDHNIRIPRSDIQPRSALAYMMMPMLRGLRMAIDPEIKKAYTLLADLDGDTSECMKHAQKMFDGSLIPVIYGVSPFKSVAYRWKTQFNENSKILAYSSSFPELNHNDTMALEGTHRKNEFYFFVFESNDPKIRKRVSVTSKITNCDFNIISPKGTSTLEKLFYLIHYGDYVSYNLGILRGKNPADVGLITKLKQEINE